MQKKGPLPVTDKRANVAEVTFAVDPCFGSTLTVLDKDGEPIGYVTARDVYQAARDLQRRHVEDI